MQNKGNITPTHRMFWLLATLEGMIALLYLGYIYIHQGDLTITSGRVLLFGSLLLLTLISSYIAYAFNKPKNHTKGLIVSIRALLSNDTAKVVLAFFAFTFVISAVYLIWVSIITTDQQLFAILQRLQPLILWLGLVSLQGLILFRRKNPGAGEKTSFPAPPGWVIFAIILVTVLAIILRLKFLFYPAHFDEIMSYQRFASSTPWKTVSFYPAPNNHVLHNLFVLFITRWFGGSISCIRMAAFVAGILAIPLTFCLGRRLFDDVTGLFAAGLLAVSSYHIQYSVNGRGYTMIVLATLAAFILADRLRQNRSLLAWFCFILVCTAGFFTIPIMLYPFLGIMLWLTFSYLAKDISPQYEGRFPLYLVLSGSSVTALTVLLYTPVIIFSGWKALSSNAFIEALSWSQLMQRMPGFLSQVWGTWVRDLPPLFTILIVAGTMLSPLRQVAQRGRHKIWLVLPLILGFSLVLVAQRAIPYTRVCLFLLPFLFLLSAAGWVFLSNDLIKLQIQRVWLVQWLSVLLLLLVIVSMAVPVYQSPAIYLEQETGSLPQADLVANYLISRIEPGDMVLSNRPGYLILSYYLQQSGVDNPSLQAWQLGFQTDRVFIIVNRFYQEDISSVINTTDLSTASGLRAPRLIKEFDGAAVYLVEMNN